MALASLNRIHVGQGAMEVGIKPRIRARAIFRNANRCLGRAHEITTCFQVLGRQRSGALHLEAIPDRQQRFPIRRPPAPQRRRRVGLHNGMPSNSGESACIRHHISALRAKWCAKQVCLVLRSRQPLAHREESEPGLDAAHEGLPAAMQHRSGLVVSEQRLEHRAQRAQTCIGSSSCQG